MGTKDHMRLSVFVYHVKWHSPSASHRWDKPRLYCSTERSDPETTHCADEQPHLDTWAPSVPPDSALSLLSSPLVCGPLCGSLWKVSCFEGLLPTLIPARFYASLLKPYSNKGPYVLLLSHGHLFPWSAAKSLELMTVIIMVLGFILRVMGSSWMGSSQRGGMIWHSKRFNSCRGPRGEHHQWRGCCFNLGERRWE